MIRDHLGSVRATVTDEAVNGDDPVMEEFHYYPFGMRMEVDYFRKLRHFPAKGNAYQYNGKELYTDLGFDWMPYGAWYYDAAVGRFVGVDPIADRFAWVSTYNYAENSPVANIDLHGLQASYYTNQLDKRFGSAEYRNSTSGQRQAQRNAEAKTVSGGLAIALTTVLPGPEDVVAGTFLATKMGKAIVRLKGIFKKSDKAVDAGKASSKADKVVENSSKYEDITKSSRGKSSTTNKETDITKSEFEGNLEKSGYEKTVSKDGEVNNYTKDGDKYSTRNKSRDYGGPSVDYKKAGSEANQAVAVQFF